MTGVAFNTNSIIRGAFQGEILTRERELELARDWRDTHSQAALDALVSAYLRLVASVAGKYARYGLPKEDLIQEGASGLLEAAQRFDPERGFRFGTYAQWWVRAAIQRYMLDNWSVVRFATSHNRKKLFFELRAVMRQIEGASVADAAAELRASEADVAALMPMVFGQDSSLDTPVGDDTDTTLLELLEDEAVGVEESVTLADSARARSRWLNMALGDLKDRDAAIVRRRHLGEEKETLSAIAADLGITKERVRQIEARALGRVRVYLEENFPGRIDDIISH